MKLSIIIPVYNESRTIVQVIDRVSRVNLDKEIIVLDDGSTDDTRQILKQVQKENPEIKVIFQDKNQGKGSVVRSGLTYTTGEVMVIQDADLEYNPEDLPKLLIPIEQGVTAIVYGSRFLGKSPKKYFLHWLANRFLTIVTNLLYHTNLTDMETCYKMFRREVLIHLNLSAKGFEFEPEFTAQVSKAGYHIVEVPISYFGRSYHEGKKISWHDGFIALGTLLRYRFL